MASTITTRALSFLSILAYVKTLDAYKTNKPSIVVGNDVYTEYYDYFIGTDGMLYIIHIQPDPVKPSNSTYTLSIVDPAAIETINVSKEFGIDYTAVPTITLSSSLNSTDRFKALIGYANDGTYNYGVPYTYMKAHFDSDYYQIAEPVYIDSGYPYFVLRSSMIEMAIMSSVKQDIVLFYEDILSLSLPLIDIESLDLYSVVPSEVQAALDQLKISWGLVTPPTWMAPGLRAAKMLPQYKKSDKVSYNGAKYISTVDNNTSEPGSADDVYGDWYMYDSGILAP